ncbi:MAG: hypothetical protein SFV52_04600 [Saprospiraceae bacterium]|nr:hypothetical protein [Saprospiraceae bacterium]
MKSAVIDLGTNTFHLLVAEKNGAGAWHTLYRERRYVKLAENGIERIGEAPFSRAMDAMRHFREQLDMMGVAPEQVRAAGTAAMRTAQNAPDLLDAIHQTYGIRAEVIDGRREAELIYKGVRQAVPWPPGTALIMDIGGGSTEFILADAQQVRWKHSFPLGAGVLLNRFQPDDPITEAQIDAISGFLKNELTPLWQALAQNPTDTLIGASGTFDVIDQFLLDPATKPATFGCVTTDEYRGLANTFLHSTRAERLTMPGLPPERVDMIVLAVLLIDAVLRNADVKTIITSAYALKEGLLAEMF